MMHTSQATSYSMLLCILTMYSVVASVLLW